MTDDTTIKRLLGPEGPEIQCDECFARIDEYVDVELLGGAADEAVPGMRAHLGGCSACHEEYESLRELARANRTA